MKTYIALLRGINVSGQKKIKMADLKDMFEKLGFDDVVTYIQSGNVVFKGDEENIDTIEEAIKRGILDVFGFDVPVLVKTREDLERILQTNPFKDTDAMEGKKMYYVLLKEHPQESLVESLAQEHYENEKCTVIDDCAYLVCFQGAGKAKLNNNLIERKLKVPATTRNYRTMMKLVELAGN